MADDSKHLPDEEPGASQDTGPSASDTGEHRHRKRIKIKKRIKQRIRVKKKPSLKKRINKLLGYLAWIIVISGFLVTAFVLVRELDVKDEDAKKKAPKKKQGWLMPNNKNPELLYLTACDKKVIHFNQAENNTALNSLA